MNRERILEGTITQFFKKKTPTEPDIAQVKRELKELIEILEKEESIANEITLK